MPKQVQKQKAEQRQEGPVTGAEVKAAAPAARDQLKDIDALLDEIEEVLVENAEEFVAKYIQKGGE